MTAVVLTKGARVNLTKDRPALKRVKAELTWQPNKFSSGYKFDLDVVAFCLTMINDQPKLLGDGAEYMAFYNNPLTADSAVHHLGDDRIGDNGEEITVDLTKLNPAIQEISFVVSIFEAQERQQNFGMVPRSKISIFDEDTGDQLCVFDLEESFSTETSIQVGSLYRKDGGIAFKAVGQGYNNGLDAFVIAYGQEVA